MKVLNDGNCFNCAKADLVSAIVELTGTVKGKTYKVKMVGLRCPICDFQTVEGSAGLTEFRRRVNDAFRAEHNLLTSAQIVDRRKVLGMTQEEFAAYVGVGVASIKRWELGKIQEGHSNDLILQKTKPAAPIIMNVSQYDGFENSGMTVVRCTVIPMGASARGGKVVTAIFGTSNPNPLGNAALISTANFGRNSWENTARIAASAVPEISGATNVGYRELLTAGGHHGGS